MTGSYAYTTYTNDALLALWKTGEITAFECFYKRSFILLADIAFFKLKDKQLAEEMAQDALYRLYKNSTRLENNPLAYCKAIIKNLVIDYYRKNKLGTVHTPGLAENTAIHTNVHTTEYKELEQQIEVQIRSLPEQCRKVFLLRREQNLTNREIAEKLGISVNTVENHMTKALSILRKKLEYFAYAGFVLSLGL